MTKQKQQKPVADLEDLGISEEFLRGPVTAAHRVLYAKLQRMIGGQYEDAYKNGPQKMARYFDSFLEFFRQEYPNENHCKGTLKSLIPTSAKIKLPDQTIIALSYDMEHRQSEYEILNPDGSISKVTNRHVEIAQMFKNNVQEGIFDTITMLVDAMPKEAREKMEDQYLDSARSLGKRNKEGK